MSWKQFNQQTLIITDGVENASQEYSANMVKKMIGQKQEYGWQFLFMGANMDAVTEAEKIGIRPNHAVKYKNDAKGVRLNYQVTNQVMSCMRRDFCRDEELEVRIPEFLKKIRRYEKESD